MLKSKKTFLIRLTVFFAWVFSGWQAWFPAHWLVGRDDIYLGLDDVGFGVISGTAEIVAFFGLIPALVFGVVLGLFAAVMLPGRDVWTEKPE